MESAANSAIRDEGAIPSAPHSQAKAQLFHDDFREPIAQGRVLGQSSTSGQNRVGVDRDRVFGIDNGALRIAPLIDAGWGKAAIAYGPFGKRNGLALCVLMLNGHNTAQLEPISEDLHVRLDRWLRGSEVHGRTERLWRWLKSGRISRTLRLFRWWFALRRGQRNFPSLDENLAVGWFGEAAPTTPVASGKGLIMHATGPFNGELWARSGGAAVPVVHGVPNVPLYYVVVLREGGAVYYAGSVPQTNRLPGDGWLRPLIIDEEPAPDNLYAVVTQSTIGQIGFRIDSRVYDVRAAVIPELADWFGSAHAADSLTGRGSLDASAAERGGRWQLRFDTAMRSELGASLHGQALALLWPNTASGLIAARFTFAASDARIALLWRFIDERNCLSLKVGPESVVLEALVDGARRTLGVASPARMLSKAALVQISDDGEQIQVYCEGERLLSLVVPKLNEQTEIGVGLQALDTSSKVIVAKFEAHSLRLRLPPQFIVKCPMLSLGDRVVFQERFHGGKRELDGKAVDVGDACWSRLLGNGHVDVLGDGSAKVRATPAQPNPGRTAYSLPWSATDFADLSLDFSIPTMDPGAKHNPRVGFLLWQDAENYLILNIWRNHSYGGASVSTFFTIDGFEDLYDAVWVNVGTRANFGDKVRLRIVFDGEGYLAFIDGEPVLFRKLTDVYPDAERLRITRVGIVANWEWGNDTGTVLNEFVARTRAAGEQT